MKKIILIATTFILPQLSLNVIAENLYSPKDSLPLHTQMIDEVVVTGTRNATDVRHLSQTVSVVSRKQIEQSMQSSLLPVLTEQVPGLFTTARGIMGYGVSGGAAGGISIRGLSGGTARMMVLIDGHPQYAGIFGHPIADAYQSFLAEKLEVLRGPASVIYGSNAMGGVVNIVTRKIPENGVRTDLHTGFGSYGTIETELTNRIRHNRFSSIISGSYNRTDGHRHDMQFEQYGGYAKVGYDITNHWNAYADLNITHFNASYPGPISAPLLDGDQRITRGVASASISNNYASTSGAISIFYNWGKHWINDGYTPSAGESSQDGRFHSSDNMMGISIYQNIQLFQGNHTTFGADLFRYGGKAYTEYVEGERKGTTNHLVDKYETEIATYADFRQNVWQWLTFNTGLRIDHHSRVGTEFVPQVGFAFHLPNNIELKTSAATGFRYPILREMYMFPPQNPDLKPESMWNYELAFTQSVINGKLSYGINLFYIDGKNLIMTLPNPNGTGRINLNSGRIYNSGLELQTTYRINQRWSADANYSYLHMTNPVVAAPKHKLHVGANFTEGHWEITTGLQYIDGLYTSIGSNPTTENFVLWNVRASYRATKWLSVWIRGDNLLAQKYEINAGYPMPRATIMGGVNINF